MYVDSYIIANNMKRTLLISFILLTILFGLKGQSLQRLKNGVLIKGNQYLDRDFNIEIQTFDLDSVIVEIAQIVRKKFDGDNFNCKAIIQTRTKNRKIDELYFDNIEPVGSSYGICFTKNQTNKKYIIGSKYGDYEGLVIIINSNGKILRKSGGNYFVSEDKKYLVSDWYSDLTGITIFDLEKNMIVYSKELPVSLSKWFENKGKYYAAQWSENKEIDTIYTFDLTSFSLSRTNLSLSKLHQFQEVNKNGCEPK